LALLLGNKVIPAVEKTLGIGHQLVPRKYLDTQVIKFGLQLGDLFVQGLESLFQRLVGPSKPFGADLVGDVELVNLIHLALNRGAVDFGTGEQFLQFSHVLIGFLQGLGEVLGREEELPELLLEDGFEVIAGNAVLALEAEIFGRIGPHLHLAAALAECPAAEQMHRSSDRPLYVFRSFENRIAFVPKVLRNDGLN
jgi:hypothetical protein